MLHCAMTKIRNSPRRNGKIESDLQEFAEMKEIYDAYTMKTCMGSKGMSMNHAHETCGRKEAKNKNNNKHEELSDDEWKEEDEECHNMLNDKKISNVVTNNKKSRCKAT